MTRPIDRSKQRWALTELGEMAIVAQEDSVRWFGDTHAAHSLVHHTLSICGEAGELANLMKKIDRNSLDWNDSHVRYEAAMELADIFTYLLCISFLMGVDLKKAYEMKRTVNQERFTKQRKEREERRAGE